MRTEIEAPPLGSLARSIALSLLVVTSLAQGAAGAGEIKDVYGLEFLGQAVLPPMLEFEGTSVGGLSAIAWDRTSGTFFVASDDPGSHGPARLYQLRIAVESGGLQMDGVGVVSTIVLKDRAGRPFRNSRVDLEGVVKIPGGGLIVSSEGQIRLGAPPFIRQFADDGTYIREFEIPPHYLNFEDRTFGLRHNLAFESLTLTPDGRYLVTASENALNQDVGTATPERSSPSRILVLDFNSGNVEGEYFYWTERMNGSGAAEDYEYAGLVALVALD